MVVPVDVNENEELHVQLRRKFFESLSTSGNNDDYEEEDLERFRNDDHYCKRFILHKKGDLEAALEMVHESLKWRKSFGVKNVNQASIPIEFFQAKAVFPYNKDKEGNPIIMILVRFHKKAPEFAELLRKFVIYWVELMEEQTSGGHMTVIMSCEGAGLSNLDLDLIKFLITLFRSYYPDSLAHILIYEFPWILNPAWKIIKAWLPQDFVEKIKFVNKTSLLEYVTTDCLPVDMGGTDTREYEPPTENDINSNEISPEPKRIANGHAGGISRGSAGEVVITDDYTMIGGIMKIQPATELKFLPPREAVRDVVIKLSCESDKAISYKVKTNNIESYRVKPSLGVIEPGKSIEITVNLLPGFHPLPSDKFLIMAMKLDDSAQTMANLNSMWKAASPDNVADHKLKCVLKKDQSEDEEVDVGKSLKNINLILANIEKKVQSLDTKQASIRLQQRFLLAIAMFMSALLLSHIFMSEDSPLVALLSKLL
ncbi:motile sperm domain-containing protein 2-like isoform X2 [Uloborus diversus]|uniref:motile sperm domain-containing protein 2-like isoform X2 n=1 Tax=Uloborus diversus TaxID=327109 RepID=UPI0024097F68|nr:motile sperm domain-containing protein 2-like isoform X2 [Uloborus diversus]